MKLRWREVFVNVTLFLPFFIVVEGLNIMMNALAKKNLFVGYGFGPHRQNSITHLQFVDDTLLVGDKSWRTFKL